ncbi:hypothetical protein FGIG_11804 [Fasciola gigantica]|uniref:Uncharacterized protein n=1 Tax=Fasciola gigantica TaxID=46835 RepID=A0A504Z0Y1_FASGI|nr:hypothetical protein FGIG_11804 [Fasciola gigantica]
MRSYLGEQKMRSTNLLEYYKIRFIAISVRPYTITEH